MRAIAGRRQFPILDGRPTTFKIRGVDLRPKTEAEADVELNTEAEVWRYHWITNYNFAGFIKPQIDLAIEAGANLVKANPDLLAYKNGGADYATMSERFFEVSDYIASKGLMAKWAVQCTSSNWGGSIDAGNPLFGEAFRRLSADIARYDNIVMFDVHNEVNAQLNVSQAAAVWDAIIPYVRQELPTMPCTMSLTNGSSNALSGFNDTFEPRVDFMDWHRYDVTSVAEFSTYRARPTATPWMLGEYGRQNAGSTPSADDVKAQLQAVDDVAALADCYGTIMFPLCTYPAGPGGDGYRGLYNDVFGDQPVLDSGGIPLTNYFRLIATGKV